MRSLLGADEPSTSRRRWRFTHIAEFALLMVGVVALGWYGWDHMATAIDQREAEQELEQTVRSRSESPAVSPERPGDAQSPQEKRTSESGKQASGKQKRAPSPVGPPVSRQSIKVGQTIGRVEIPRLKISAVVRAGVDDRTLKRAVGHVPSTALPGEPGNIGIAAHRDTFFRNLKGVRNGDKIRMVTAAGTYEYEVDSTKIVMPKNVEVLDPTSENVLTLVTCYPFNYVGSAPKRFIVRAREIQPEKASGKAIAATPSRSGG